MKRLTWALLSLMLFFGMGTAFADVEQPVITPATGSAVTIGDMVTITCATSGATIHYTTTNTFVSESDPVYTEPFALTEAMIKTSGINEGKIIIKAVAYLNGDNSDPATATYSDITITPAITVEQPVITPDNAVGKIKLNEKVTITCATGGASIYYTLDKSTPSAAGTLYEAPFLLPENTPVDEEITIRAIAIKDGVSSDPSKVILMVEAAGDPDPVTPPTPVTKPNAPKFEINGEEVTAATLEVNATKVEVKWIGDETNEDHTVVYTLDGSEAVFNATSMFDEVLEDANYWEFGEEAFDVTVPATIKARVAAATQDGDITWSDMVTLDLTSAVAAPVTLTFTPASSSEVEDGTAVTIMADQDVDIFYMMFESEEAAKAAEWDQELAESYSDELKPVVRVEKTTIKAAYAYPDAETLAEGFFYATYTVKVQPDIELTFNPAPGSKVKAGTEVTVTASRETEIFYNLYADKAAADADTLFMATAKEVKEDGKPVITKDSTYLRCVVTDKGEMKYFDAVYTIDVTANEDEELSGVSVYPNPSNGVINIDLPVAASIEVFAVNGMLYQRVDAVAGSTTLTINRSGIYFLRITGEGRTAIKRIIVR